MADERYDARLFEEEDLDRGDLSKNASAKALQQQRLAQTLEEALTFIRTQARNDDLFAGFTFREAMRQRVEEIGEEPDSGKVPARLTAQSRLLLLRQEPSVGFARTMRYSSGLQEIPALLEMKSRVLEAIDSLLDDPEEQAPEEAP